MRFVGVASALTAGLLLAGCGQTAQDPSDIGTVKVLFPNGKSVRAQRLTHQLDMAAGMKWRTSVPEDRGMLFVFAQEVQAPFWMYEVKVPLDIIWMGPDRVIRRIEANTQPCPGPREICPSYGADTPAQYVLEIAGGVAAKNNLRTGMRLDF